MSVHGKVHKQGWNVSMYRFAGMLANSALWVKTKRAISAPVVASILQNRLFAVVIIVTVCLQMGLTALGLKGWVCPFRSTLGVSCPGCGLSTALAHLIQGNWIAALHAHVFAPIVLIGFFIIAGVSLLPRRYYFTAVYKIEEIEKASGFMSILLAAMIIYWVFRLLYFT